MVACSKTAPSSRIPWTLTSKPATSDSKMIVSLLLERANQPIGADAKTCNQANDHGPIYNNWPALTGSE